MFCFLHKVPDQKKAILDPFTLDSNMFDYER